jgi:hypothetical protein
MLLLAYAASFYLVPQQIMLATANRLGVRFSEFFFEGSSASPQLLVWGLLWLGLRQASF